MRIPVVLSTVHVDVGTDGHLQINIDGQPHADDRQHLRSDLRTVLDEITTGLGTAVRVEIRECDGTTYSDIATPHEAADDKPQDGAPMAMPPAGLHGTGFLPGEEVAYACVLCTETADADGRTVARLPPSLLTQRRHRIVLVGMTSAAVAEIGQPA
jgi:hypothetical protein